MLSFSLFRNDPRIVAVRASKPLFVEGDSPGLMYILTAGEARILIGGQEVGRLYPGEVTGEMSLIDHEPHSATVEAVTNCEFVCVDENRLNFLVTETPGFALKLMRVMSERLRATDRRIAGS
jgi:CRP-like cAMP-binding protein